MTLILPLLDLEAATAASSETQRVEDLISLRGLIASSDIRFDRYTEIATTALEIPMAALVLVEEDHLHFKSVRGVSPADTARHESFAEHVLEEPEILIVTDARLDSRFAKHPLVKNAPHIRFYAGAVIRGPSGAPLGAICVMDTVSRDLPEKQRGVLLQLANLIEHEIETLETVEDLRKRIQEHAFVDPISRLPTQELFLTRLSQWIEGAPSAERIVVTLLRIDRYEAIYIAVGKAGAAYLVGEVVSRLKEAIGASCLMGHLREDTIGLAYRANDSQSEDAGLKALLSCIRTPIRLGGHRIIVRGHLGVATFPDDASNAETLVKRARTALHANLPSDSNKYRLYSPELSAEAARSFEIESALKGALERNELQLVFQAKVNIANSRLVGAEALLRWGSATLGSVSPAEFIPIAEESGLIVELGAWVLEDACRQLAEWNRSGYRCPEVSVNISSFQLRQHEFCEHVEGVLRDTSLAGAQLNLELTEGSLIENIEEAIDIMRRLQGSEITFSIDDFGKGFSSLSYLREMPVQALKIDRQFIKRIPEDRNDRMLVQSIIAMGHALGLKVVAEGVERPEQLDALKEYLCDEVQGFIFGRPQTATDFVQRYLLPSVGQSKS